MSQAKFITRLLNEGTIPKEYKTIIDKEIKDGYGPQDESELGDWIRDVLGSDASDWDREIAEYIFNDKKPVKKPAKKPFKKVIKEAKGDSSYMAVSYDWKDTDDATEQWKVACENLGLFVYPSTGMDGQDGYGFIISKKKLNPKQVIKAETDSGLLPDDYEPPSK